MLYYGVSHRGEVRDESGDFSPFNVGIIHAFQFGVVRPCWLNVGPASQTMGQHSSDIG